MKRISSRPAAGGFLAALLLGFAPLAVRAQSLSDIQGAGTKKPATNAAPVPRPEAETTESESPIRYKIRIFLKVTGDGPYVETVRGAIFRKLSLLPDVALVEKDSGEDLAINCLVTQTVNAGGDLSQIVTSYAVTSQIYNKVGIYAVSITQMPTDRLAAIDRSFKNSGALVDHFISTALPAQMAVTVGNDAAKIDKTDIEQVRKFYNSMSN
jgi:hypothetical protein